MIRPSKEGTYTIPGAHYGSCEVIKVYTTRYYTRCENDCGFTASSSTYSVLVNMSEKHDCETYKGAIQHTPLTF